MLKSAKLLQLHCVSELLVLIWCCYCWQLLWWMSATLHLNSNQHIDKEFLISQFVHPRFHSLPPRKELRREDSRQQAFNKMRHGFRIIVLKRQLNMNMCNKCPLFYYSLYFMIFVNELNSIHDNVMFYLLSYFRFLFTFTSIYNVVYNNCGGVLVTLHKLDITSQHVRCILGIETSLRR